MSSRRRPSCARPHPTCSSLSHEILRKYREYERISNAVVNGYVGLRVSDDLQRLEGVLALRSYPGRVFIVQSNGGVMAPETVRMQPARTMESRPVGGAIAAAGLAERLGLGRAVVFDMGGTTAKAALIRDDQPDMSDGYFVGGPVTGHPVMLPVVDVIEVGAGGGSIAAVDEVVRSPSGRGASGTGPTPALTQFVLGEQARVLVDRGKAVLIVEQRAKAALELADWAYVMVQGRVAMSASGREVLNHPEMAEVFLGGGSSAAHQATG